MRGWLVCALAGLSTTLGVAQIAPPELGGQLRVQWDARQANDAGPLAAANRLQPGIVVAPSSGATVEAELRAAGKWWNATATLQQQALQGHAGSADAWFNELALSFDAGRWQLGAGKKIVAWDVGYGFRPNDVVQQEQRRQLVTSTAEGRPLLMAEHFDAETAWSLVWVNPGGERASLGAREPALAARVYRRDGAVDWHGFARLGVRTGASLGAAAAWVASDALELHASVRALERADTLAIDPLASALVTRNPWRPASVRHAAQALVGGTWTHHSRVGLLAEAWWDGTAPSDAQWSAWQRRNRLLAGLPALGAPVAAVAGNLAWQGNAFSASPNLRRASAFVRASWEVEGWQPSLDALWMPGDGGRIVTAALLWKGDALQMQGGLRVYGGPPDALLAQLPTRRHAFLAATWAF